VEEAVPPCICFYVHLLAAGFDAAYFFQQVDMPVWLLNSFQLGEEPLGCGSWL
jgi:hypothetical protein